MLLENTTVDCEDVDEEPSLDEDDGGQKKTRRGNIAREHVLVFKNPKI